MELRLSKDPQVEQFRIRPQNLSKKCFSDRTNVRSSNPPAESMKKERSRMTAEANRTRPNGWPSQPEQRQLASVRVDPPLKEYLILCLIKFFASFVFWSLRYLHQLCVDTRYCLEDRWGAKIHRDWWHESLYRICWQSWIELCHAKRPPHFTLINWLILTACQIICGYFMPRG